MKPQRLVVTCWESGEDGPFIDARIATSAKAAQRALAREQNLPIVRRIAESERDSIAILDELVFQDGDSIVANNTRWSIDLKPPMSECYTAIGLFRDSGQTWSAVVTCPREHAWQVALQKLPADTDLTNFECVGLIAGDHTLLAPCEDSGCTAFACDLIGEEQY